MGSRRGTLKTLVTTGLPTELADRIDKIAAREGTNRAALLRKFIIVGYKAYIREQREIRELREAAAAITEENN